jgi:hypothetical protein
LVDGVNNQFERALVVDFIFHVLLGDMASSPFEGSLSVFLPQFNAELVSIAAELFFVVLHTNTGNIK